MADGDIAAAPAACRILLRETLRVIDDTSLGIRANRGDYITGAGLPRLEPLCVSRKTPMPVRRECDLSSFHGTDLLQVAFHVATFSSRFPAFEERDRKTQREAYSAKEYDCRNIVHSRTPVGFGLPV